MSTIIKIENLGKKYIIGHQRQGRYETLRDTLAHIGRGMWQRIRHPLSANQEEVELEEIWALKDINFEVKQGERIGIIGRNGAGKSTLLKILSRITDPTTGRVHLKGRVASLLEVGTGFHPELSGKENIFLNGAVLGMTKKEITHKFDEIVAFAEIEKFLDTPVKRYSSGMYVRLAFAVAAHLEPEILVVDEVLAVGDMQFQKKCLGRMGEVSREGRTVLFVSHNLTAIRSLCNKALLLKDGKITFQGSAPEVTKKYLDESQQHVLSRAWSDNITAPHNASACLHKVEISDNAGNALNAIYTGTPFTIRIEFEVIAKEAFVGLTIIFYDRENNCLFGTINNHESQWYGKPMPHGNYCSICEIPGNLFNNGSFSISMILFGKNFTDAVTENEILKFEILDGPGVRGDFFGDYAGSLRPQLEWKTLSS